MTPSSTRSCSTGTPSFCEADCMRSRRAWAEALRSGFAPEKMPVLPEAPPWLQVRAVSPMTTSTLSTATSSSSATIWAIAISSDWPMSILPKKAVARPSGVIATQESSLVGRRGGLPPGWARALPMKAGPAAETTSAPEAFRNSRRESGKSTREFIVVSSGHLRLSALDRAQDGDVRPAAALEARERFAQLRVARLRVLVQVGRRGHDPAVDAVAALRHLLLYVGGLQRVRLLRRAQAFQRRYLLALHRRERHHAGAHRFSVQVHGARAALREPAAEVRIAHLEIVAQSVEERHARVAIDRHRLAVDGEFDACHEASFCGCAALLESGRSICETSLAPVQCRRNAMAAIAAVVRYAVA